jgi:hypothetical protein
VGVGVRLGLGWGLSLGLGLGLGLGFEGGGSGHRRERGMKRQIVVIPTTLLGRSRVVVFRVMTYDLRSVRMIAYETGDPMVSCY